MQKKKLRKVRYKVLMFFCLCILGTFCVRQKVQAGLWENPYITFSPDGHAFTTNAGELNTRWYEKGKTVFTGEKGTLRAPEKGEHLYSTIVTGNVSVSKWVVEHMEGRCVHNGPISVPIFHGVEFSKTICHRHYYSGWCGYCADCGRKAVINYVYMSDATAASIKEVDLSLAYYYLCPWCTHLEQGCELMHHVCKSISANQYSVRYHANFGNGSMPKSVHMYNNAAEYEGKKIVPQKTLSLNRYTRAGYEFAGWNTKKDGSGRYFSDGEEIFNLCTGEQESITLYAQWTKKTDDKLWPVATEKVHIDMDENVHDKGGVYYVKADGSSPFTVSFDSRVLGNARRDYQINQVRFFVQKFGNESEKGFLQLQMPMETEIAPGTYTYTGENLRKQYDDNFCLTDTSFATVKRGNYCRDVSVSQSFCISEEMDGVQLRLTPGAAVVWGNVNVVSERTQDIEHGIDLIADGKGPIITGLELPKDFSHEKDGVWRYTLEVQAWDTGSGLEALWIEIKNADNGSEKRIEDEDGDGRISFELTSQKELFWGEFVLIAGAKDSVGNESSATYNVDGISVNAYIEKILDSQSHSFKKGESGRLHIRTTGYVDHVEVSFPKEWSRYVTSPNRVYAYKVPVFMQTEELEFMVPLGLPDGEYTIVVKAYKGEKMIEADPRLLTFTVAGSVLDEIRTRLR